MAEISAVPCLTCQRDYRQSHSCDAPDHCACDRWREHIPPGGARSTDG